LKFLINICQRDCTFDVLPHLLERCQWELLNGHIDVILADTSAKA